MDFAGCKAEQLKAITQLLAASITGGIALADSAKADFALMANAFACDMDRLMTIIAGMGIKSQEGGT